MKDLIKNIPVWGFLVAGAALVLLQVVVLWLLGQPAICECGYIKFWEGTVVGPGNSQHITDWYTPSHFLHGFIFYWAATFFWPRAHWSTRLLIALGVEVTWEVLENSSMIIDRYRQTGLAQGYSGDSILNSVSDTVAMAFGFLAARKLPIMLSVVLIVGVELVSLYVIRDSLLLNVLNLLHPFEFIQSWQLGAAR